ncbi:MAG: RNA repair domain-containing protein [Methanomassiliicoccales archaeon]
MFPKEILNELKWRPGYDLAKAEVHILHRGAPDNTRIISGAEIRELDRYYFKVGNIAIPYHRVVKILYEGKTLYESRKLRSKNNKECL